VVERAQVDLLVALVLVIHQQIQIILKFRVMLVVQDHQVIFTHITQLLEVVALVVLVCQDKEQAMEHQVMVV
tara:strand:+ start:161 stop:376 length:216 start_codon:yes stop_codon:yes gene_type:complete